MKQQFQTSLQMKMIIHRHLKKKLSEPVLQYYSEFIIETLFHLSDTSEKVVLKIMQNIDILKAAGKFPGKGFWKIF